MGKGQKRKASGSVGLLVPDFKGRSNFGSFVTVGDLIKAPCISSSATNAPTSPIKTGRVWHRKHEKIDECIYHLTISQPHPIAVICHESEVSELTGTLKNLYRPYETANAVQITSVTIKQQRKALEKIIRKTISTNRGIIITSKECVMLTKSCCPDHVQIKTVIHVCNEQMPSIDDMRIRNLLLNGKKDKDNNGDGDGDGDAHVFITNFTSPLVSPSQSPSVYNVQRRWMPVIQARVSAARKLYVLMKEGGNIWNEGGDRDMKQLERSMNKSDKYTTVITDEANKAMAGRVEGLRTKLAVAMSTPLPGGPNMDINANTQAKTKAKANVKTNDTTGTESGTEIGTGTDDKTSAPESKKSRRSKMILLGMVHVQSKEEQLHQAK